MSTIKIPTPLRAYTAGQSEIPVTGETVGAALNDLLTQYPDLRQHLFEGSQLRNFVNVFVGEEDIRYRDGLNTDLSPTENLRIIPSIAGGRSFSSEADS
jgi:molybdopterin converting factor small subunit